MKVGLSVLVLKTIALPTVVSGVGSFRGREADCRIRCRFDGFGFGDRFRPQARDRAAGVALSPSQPAPFATFL